MKAMMARRIIAMFGTSYTEPLSHLLKVPMDSLPLPLVPLPQLLIVSQKSRRVSENPSNTPRMSNPPLGAVGGGVYPPPAPPVVVVAGDVVVVDVVVVTA